MYAQSIEVVLCRGLAQELGFALMFSAKKKKEKKAKKRIMNFLQGFFFY